MASTSAAILKTSIEQCHDTSCCTGEQKEIQFTNASWPWLPGWLRGRPRPSFGTIFENQHAAFPPGALCVNQRVNFAIESCGKIERDLRLKRSEKEDRKS